LADHTIDWTPTRDEGLRRLKAFVPLAGRAYAARRNLDYGAGYHTSVSVLSPYLRHRLVTETEVVAAVLEMHSSSAAEKFIQEVCWRTYWKGWLEQRPQVWTDYLDEVAAQRTALREDDAAAAEIAVAESGDTGIQCFDAWAHELIETGYLHNHARMWFASIWIFTLKLPWTLGADFFLRHLLDGDPASNTLSWRWVAGLHTRGKTYLARPDNIAEYTAGRFQPGRDELASFAPPLRNEAPVERVARRSPDVVPKGTRALLLVTEEDLSPETWPLVDVDVRGIAMFVPDSDAGKLSPQVQAFKAQSMNDAETRAGARWGQPVTRVTTSDELITFAANQDAVSCVTTLVPVGLVRPEIDNWTTACRTAGVPLLQIERRWDSLFWPHATAGFFKLKERIPVTLAKLGLTPAERPS
jgi:deoxyribodipyrimidine photo-lyase